MSTPIQRKADLVGWRSTKLSSQLSIVGRRGASSSASERSRRFCSALSRRSRVQLFYAQRWQVCLGRAEYSGLMFQVEAVPMTKAEADLHNEINQRHWSRKLGMEMFTIKERMVKEEELSSLIAFLNFLEKRFISRGSLAPSDQVCVPLLLYTSISLSTRSWSVSWELAAKAT